MNAWRQNPVIRFLGSYALGIVVLALLMVLLVIGTLYQTENGIHRAQQLVFSSYVFTYPFGPISLPLPGARLLMLILFVNLLLATIFRMRYRRLIIGVYVVHAGILLLLIGGFISAYSAVEGYMRIPENEASNFSSRYHDKELVIMRDNPDGETVTAIYNLRHAAPGTALITAVHGLPFTLELVRAFPDHLPRQDETGEFARKYGINAGLALNLSLAPMSRSDQDVTVLSCVLRLKTAGEDDRVFLLADTFNRDYAVAIDSVIYRFRLRNRRDYYPFSIYLQDFERKTYPGSSINRSFSSSVIFIQPEKDVERRARIYMNHPLRHGLFTFYQSSFDENDTVTVLSVVKNSGLAFPYISAIVIAIGLVIQFISVSWRKVRRQVPDEG